VCDLTNVLGVAMSLRRTITPSEVTSDAGSGSKDIKHSIRFIRFAVKYITVRAGCYRLWFAWLVSPEGVSCLILTVGHYVVYCNGKSTKFVLEGESVCFLLLNSILLLSFLFVKEVCLLTRSKRALRFLSTVAFVLSPVDRPDVRFAIFNFNWTYSRLDHRSQ